MQQQWLDFVKMVLPCQAVVGGFTESVLEGNGGLLLCMGPKPANFLLTSMVIRRLRILWKNV